MSGTQGRFPPPVPPQGQRRPESEYPAPHPSQGHHPAPAWPPVGGQQHPAPQQHAPQPPAFPPRNMAPQKPAYQDPGYPPRGAADGHSGGGPAWSPAPPAPYPPIPAPQAPRQPQMPAAAPPAQGYGYPGSQYADVPRTEPSRRPVEPRMPDPSGYDLGSYGLPPAQPPVPPSARDPRTAQPMPPMPHPSMGQMQPQWQQQPATDPYGRPPPQPHPGGAPPFAYAPSSQGQPQAAGMEPEEDEDFEPEEPPRRGRRWMIAAALVGSIAIGSGMAYAYKMYLGSRVTADAKSRLVRASLDPVKVPPADRGGKQFANTDSRVLNNRVPAEGSASASGGEIGSASTTDSNGVRRVATVPVGPGGSSGAVPGMMVVGGNPSPTLPVSMMETPRPQGPNAIAAPPPSLPPPVQPQRIAAASPPPTPPTTPARQPVARAPAAEAEQKTAAVAPKPPAAERPKVVSGYVAVLGFQKSQMDAMRMMADLQQKYEALRDKRLEVIQSDQSARGLGTIYRIVAGPRSGIAPVRDLCNSLFQAGMSKQGCYPLGE